MSPLLLTSEILHSLHVYFKSNDININQFKNQFIFLLIVIKSTCYLGLCLMCSVALEGTLKFEKVTLKISLWLSQIGTLKREGLTKDAVELNYVYCRISYLRNLTHRL